MLLMRRLNASAQHFAANTSGSVALIFVLGLSVLIACLGIAIDVARARNASAQVLDSLDEAALAATENMVDNDVSVATVNNSVAAFLDGTLGNPRLQGATYSGLKVQADPVAGSVSIDVDVNVPTTFLRLFNESAITFHRFTKTAYKVNNVELAMVLDTTGSMGQNNKINELKAAAAQAIDILLPPNKATANRIALAPYDASVNVSPFDSIASAGASTNGCVVERQGPDAYTDASPLPADPVSTANTPCPAQTIIPLTKNGSMLKATINTYAPGTSTAGHIGLAWGWCFISPNWTAVFPKQSAPKPYTNPSVIKAVLLMTDGAFNTSYFNGATSTAQAMALCDGMKAAGIKIYTVGLELASNPPPDDVNAPILLKYCASPDGQGGTEFYDVANGANLGAAFSTIAGKLSHLRLSN
jgi:Flp pilus assembly protein TadG